MPQAALVQAPPLSAHLSLPTSPCPPRVSTRCRAAHPPPPRASAAGQPAAQEVPEARHPALPPSCSVNTWGWSVVLPQHEQTTCHGVNHPTAPPPATPGSQVVRTCDMGTGHQTTAPQDTSPELGRMGGRLCGTPGSAQAGLPPPLPLLLRLLGMLSSGAAAACCRRRRSPPAGHWLDPPLRLLLPVCSLHRCCRCCCLLARHQLAGVPATL